MKRFEIIDRSRRKRFNPVKSFIFLSMVKTCYFLRPPRLARFRLPRLTYKGCIR